MLERIDDNKLEKILAVSVTLALCIQRLSVAISNIFFVFSYLLIFVKIFKLYKKARLVEAIKNKEFFKILFVCIVCFIPSVLFSPSIVFSFRQLVEIFFYRIMPFLSFSIVIKDELISRKIFAVFSVVFSLDCLMALYQVLTGIEKNGSGFGMHYLHLAAILCMMVPVFLIGVLDKNFERNVKIFFGVCFVCSLIGVGAGFSRGACLITALLTILIIASYTINNPKLILILLLVTGLTVGVFYTQPKISERIISVTDTTSNGSNIDRFLMWRGCLAITKDYPISGCGFGNYAPLYEKSYRLKGANYYVHAHNNYFQLLSETGIVGFLGYMYFCFGIFFVNFKHWIQTKSPYRMMLWTSWIGFLLFGFFEYTFDHGDVTKIWWFLLGLLLCLDRWYNKRINENENTKE